MLPPACMFPMGYARVVADPSSPACPVVLRKAPSDCNYLHRHFVRDPDAYTCLVRSNEKR